MQEIIFADDGIKVVRNVQQEVVFLGTAGIQGAPGKGVALGGNTGDILTKLSADDYDTAWTPANNLADKTYTQDFTAAATVTVTHNLGKRPAVTVIDTASDEVVGEVEHLSLNQLQVSFSAPFSGVVICN
jgi:hypothetical protein